MLGDALSGGESQIVNSSSLGGDPVWAWKTKHIKITLHPINANDVYLIPSIDAAFAFLQNRKTMQAETNLAVAITV